MKKLNWNKTVKVKLTDLGKEVYYHQYDELNDYYRRIHPHSGPILPATYPDVNENGFSEFQLWKFMQLYGRHIGMAMPNVCEELNFYIEDDDLEEVQEK